MREDQNIGKFRAVGREYLGAPARRAAPGRHLLPVRPVPRRGRRTRSCSGSERCSSPTTPSQVGTIIAFLLYLDQFFSPIQQLSQVFDTWQQARRVDGQDQRAHGDALRHSRARSARRPGPRHRRHPLRGRALPLPDRGRRGAPRRRPRRRAGRDRRARRRDRRREVDHRQAGRALLRRDRRTRPDRRRARRRARPRRLPPAARLRAPGAVPVLGHRARQHRLRTARRRPTPTSSARPGPSAPTTSSPDFPAATCSRSPSGAGRCRPASAS